jgi:hypothetical protein
MNITKFLDICFPDITTRDPETIRQKIYECGINSSYEPVKSNNVPGKVQNRMIFHVTKNQRKNYSNELQRECNGLVICTKTWKPVVIPPLLFRSNVQTNIVNGHLASGLYDMIPVSDGTVVSFYYWKPRGQWRIATSRGYDMTECKWGKKTYLQLWGEICELYGFKSTDEFFETLDKTRSHTIGFKHEDMHPFCEDICTKTNTRRAWFIQSASLTDFEDVVYENESIIPNQVLFEAPDNTRPIYKSLNNALQQFLNHGVINFGFILRSRDPDTTKDHTHIMFESHLMKDIRHLWYHSDLHRNAMAMGYDRETYTIVSSYLDPNRKDRFSRLFPQYFNAFSRLNDITSDIIHNIIEYAKNPIDHDSSMGKKIKTLYHSMSHDFTINPNDKYITKILMTYLLDPRWVNLYYDLYTTDELSTIFNAM